MHVPTFLKRRSRPRPALLHTSKHGSLHAPTRPYFILLGSAAGEGR